MRPPRMRRNGEERAMYNLNDYDERFQRHERTTAAVDRDGWMKPQRKRRAVRAAIAKALLALANRLAPPDVADAPTLTTVADVQGA